MISVHLTPLQEFRVEKRARASSRRRTDEHGARAKRRKKRIPRLAWKRNAQGLAYNTVIIELATSHQILLCCITSKLSKILGNVACLEIEEKQH